MLISIFLKMFVSLKSKMIIPHILIFGENDLIIYPPENPTKLYLYNYLSLNPLAECVYASNDTGNCPYCIYRDSIKDPNDIVIISDYLIIIILFQVIALNFLISKKDIINHCYVSIYYCPI